eukprot:3256766-Rhodomonas_salina.2
MRVLTAADRQAATGSAPTPGPTCSVRFGRSVLFLVFGFIVLWPLVLWQLSVTRGELRLVGRKG